MRDKHKKLMTEGYDTETFIEFVKASKEVFKFVDQIKMTGKF